MPITSSKSLFGARAASALILLGALSACGKSDTSASLTAQAKQFEQKGEYKAAIIQLKNALEIDPDDGAARLLLGQVYNTTGDTVSAEKELRKAISLKSHAEAAMPELAKALLAQREFQKVLDLTSASGTRVSVETLNLRGNAYLALGQLDKAKDAFETALRVREQHPQALIGLARHALLGQDMAGAQQLAAQATTNNPNSTEAWMFQGGLSQANGQGAAAAQAFDRVLAIDPAHGAAHLERAAIDIAEKKFDLAKEHVAAAQKASPNNLMVVYTQALLDFSQDRYTQARDSLQKILRVAPEHLPTILLSGAVEFKLDSMEQAERHLRKYLEKNPGHPYARKLLVSTYLKRGRTSEAQAALAPALGAAQDDPHLLALAGEAAMQQRDFDKARGYFQQASTLAPKVSSLRTALAMSKLGKGDSDSAIVDLEASTKLDSTSSRAGILLVMTELRLKRYDKALEAVKVLEASQASDPMVHNLKGGVYLAKNDPAKARASFKHALTLQPLFFPAVANLANLALAEKQAPAARTLMLDFIKKDPTSIDAMNFLARMAANAGQAAEATDWLEKANAVKPEAIGPALQLAGHYLSLQQAQRAQTMTRKLLIAHPENADVLMMLGKAQMLNSDQTGAIETFSKLVNVVPKSALPHVQLAAAYHGTGNAAAAKSSLNKALALAPESIEARVLQIDMLARKGELDQALQIARQIQKLQAKDAGGFMIEGNLLLAQKKPALAAGLFEQALSRSDTAAVIIKLHGAMLMTGQTDAAGKRLGQWQKAHPDDVLTQLYQAENDIAANNYKAAAQKLEAVLKVRPNDPAALNNLAWSYQQLKDPRALAMAESALKAAPGNYAVMDTLGWLLVEQGQHARAIALLQKAVSLAPDAPEVRYHLAVGLLKAGEKAKAHAELSKLLAGAKPFPEIEAARALLKTL